MRVKSDLPILENQLLSRSASKGLVVPFASLTPFYWGISLVKGGK